MESPRNRRLRLRDLKGNKRDSKREQSEGWKENKKREKLSNKGEEQENSSYKKREIKSNNKRD